MYGRLVICKKKKNNNRQELAFENNTNKIVLDSEYRNGSSVYASWIILTSYFVVLRIWI